MALRQIIADDVSNSSAILEEFSANFGGNLERDLHLVFTNHPLFMVLNDKQNHATRVIKDFLGNPIKMMMSPIDDFLEIAKSFPKFSPQIVNTRSSKVILGQMSKVVKKVLPDTVFSGDGF